MIDGLKLYPEYKNSCMRWLEGSTPALEVLPGRSVFREINDRGHPEEEMLSVMWQDENERIRLGGQKSPWLVSAADLAELIDRQRERAG